MREAIRGTSHLINGGTHLLIIVIVYSHRLALLLVLLLILLLILLLVLLLLSISTVPIQAPPAIALGGRWLGWVDVWSP